jgi:NADH-quinone oxidoreductase subunit G
MLALKDLMSTLGSANTDCRQDGAALDASRREFYTFNSSIAGIEAGRCASCWSGSNPRREAPVVNARIPQALARWRVARSASIGPVADLDAIRSTRSGTGRACWRRWRMGLIRSRRC